MLFTSKVSDWVAVETHDRCNNSMWFTVKKELYEKYVLETGKAEPPPTSTQKMRSAPATQPATTEKPLEVPRVIRHVHYECDVGGKKKQDVWVTLECGLVLTAVSQWDLRIRSKKNRNGTHGWL